MNLLRIAHAAHQVALQQSRKSTVTPGAGHRSIITAADNKSNELIYQELLAEYPNCRILSEEKYDHPAYVPHDDPSSLFADGQLGFVADSLDSTASFAADLPGWSVGIAEIWAGSLRAGAVYSSGLGVYAEAGSVFVNGESTPTTCPQTPRKSAIVGFGTDAYLYENFTRLLPKITTGVLAVTTSMSGLTGLAWVASGKLQAVVQPPQRIWDWAAGYSAVVGSGRKFQFFRLTDGNLVPLQDYDYTGFISNPPENRLGYVAGEPELVDALFALFPHRGWEAIAVESVEAKW